MSITGIIAEFNPLHNGHKFLINKAKRNGEKVVVILSSDFVQRGDCAIFNKETRTKAALICGADLVIELPTVWSMASAEKFALGAISLLKETNVVDRVSFGAQTENFALLRDIADYLNSEEFSNVLKAHLSANKTFASIRENIVKEKFDLKENLLKDGNNILAIEYIRACSNLDFSPQLVPIMRVGANHDSLNTVNEFSSATYLRKFINENKLFEVSKFIPNELLSLYSSASVSDISRIHNAILFKLRSMNENDFKNLPDLSEGIENRLYKAIQTAKDFEELLELLKTKRYTLSRIRRLVLNAAIGINLNDLPVLPPYIRVLGFRKASEELVKKISKNSSLPVIINSKQANLLTDSARKIFDMQIKATNLYNLTVSPCFPCGTDLTFKTVKFEK